MDKKISSDSDINLDNFGNGGIENKVWL